MGEISGELVTVPSIISDKWSINDAAFWDIFMFARAVKWVKYGQESVSKYKISNYNRWEEWDWALHIKDNVERHWSSNNEWWGLNVLQNLNQPPKKKKKFTRVKFLLLAEVNDLFE